MSAAPESMRIAIFAHSWLSDWNHGNAHFLRGWASALARRGHEVDCYEPLTGPWGGWSLSHLLEEPGGRASARATLAAYPELRIRFFSPSPEPPTAESFPVLAATGATAVASLEDELAETQPQCVIVHEWNDPELLRALLRWRPRHGYRVLFHDTHHRALSQPESMRAFAVPECDGVLAFGESLRQVYAGQFGARRSFTLHEAADTERFHPLPAAPGVEPCDLVWIGNWGDEERTGELRRYLFEPVARLGLRARVHGVRFPAAAAAELRRYAIDYAGYLPNLEVPRALAGGGPTLHVPRRPYRERLPGIPTIRVFEALACGAALLSAPWDDDENLFTAGADYWPARDGAELAQLWRRLRRDPERGAELARHGLETVRRHHTCDHRARQLEEICHTLA